MCVVYVHTCAWKAEEGVGCLALSLCVPPLKHFPTEPGDPCLPTTHNLHAVLAGVTGICGLPWLFIWVLGLNSGPHL